MNIPSVQKINAANPTKLGRVTVRCAQGGLTDVLDSRTKNDDVNLTAVSQKYLERFANENQAN